MSRSRATLVAVLAAALLAACGTSTAGSSGTSAPSGSPSATAGVTASDPWVKAVDSGMTAAFVTLTNTGTEPQTLVSASTPASSMVQLHEMVMKDGQMVMQEKKGGIAVPASGSTTLEPGGNHIMFMDVTAPIKVGDTVPVTLTFASGETLTIQAVAKTYDGAKESYAPSASPSMSGM